MQQMNFPFVFSIENPQQTKEQWNTEPPSREAGWGLARPALSLCKGAIHPRVNHHEGVKVPAPQALWLKCNIIIVRNHEKQGYYYILHPLYLRSMGTHRSPTDASRGSRLSTERAWAPALLSPVKSYVTHLRFLTFKMERIIECSWIFLLSLLWAWTEKVEANCFVWYLDYGNHSRKIAILRITRIVIIIFAFYIHFMETSSRLMRITSFSVALLCFPPINFLFSLSSHLLSLY